MRESVERIRRSPLVPDHFEARGFVFDVRTGEPLAVAGAETAAPH